MHRILLAAVFIGASLANAAPPEVRGVRLTNADHELIASPAKIAAAMRRLHEIGCNTVYIECWNDGHANFPSETLARAIHSSDEAKAAVKDIAPDLLGDEIIEAHRNGLLCIGTFGGFAIDAKGSRLFQAKRDWLTNTVNGEIVTASGEANLNPLREEAQRLLIDLTLDALKRYDLDGVEVDDRIGLPLHFGHDTFTRERYKKETKRDVPMSDADPAWMKWRAEKVSEFALRYVTEIRAARPELILSVAPSPYPSSFSDNSIDWMRWTQWCYCGARRWTEYVPQLCERDAAVMMETLQAQVDQVDEEKVNLVAGLSARVDAENLPFDTLQQVIESGRKLAIAGHVISPANSIFSSDGEKLESLYDVEHSGPASNPFKASDWRPPPIVPTRGAGDVWRADVKQAGRYRIVVKKTDLWAEVASIDLDVGPHTFVQDGDAVELLSDRRP